MMYNDIKNVTNMNIKVCFDKNEWGDFEHSSFCQNCSKSIFLITPCKWIIQILPPKTLLIIFLAGLLNGMTTVSANRATRPLTYGKL